MFGKKKNFSLIVHYISLVLAFEGLFMLTTAVVAIIYREPALKGILSAAGMTFFTGILINIITRKWRHTEPGQRESILIVFLSWIILGLTGALPYILTQSIPHFPDAVFESVSGFTTTGSSILTDIEALPKSILFWRSLTHWIGGIGIIVMVIAIMPFLNIRGNMLFGSEASKVMEDSVTTKVRYVARNFGMIYAGLTIAEIISLVVAGMPVFDSICHSFGTIATGGFSTKNNSIAGYSPAIHYIIIVFMILAGLNFTLHFLAVKGKFRKVWKNEELRLYLAIIAGVTLILTFVLWVKMNYSPEWAFRSSFFQVASIITATGFVTDDYLLWPSYANMFIAMLMLTGASAGSTGGGVKVIRHLIVIKKIKNYFRSIIHPSAYIPVHYGNKTMSPDQISGIIGFVILYFLIVVSGTLVMMFLGYDFGTSFGSVATTMEGCGPGFGTVGPVSNYAHLSDVAKFILSVSMVTGRLEIYPVLILLTRWFWIT
jgi:trk system potassium uptake protein